MKTLAVRPKAVRCRSTTTTGLSRLSIGVGSDDGSRSPIIVDATRVGESVVPIVGHIQLAEPHRPLSLSPYKYMAMLLPVSSSEV